MKRSTQHCFQTALKQRGSRHNERGSGIQVFVCQSVTANHESILKVALRPPRVSCKKDRYRFARCILRCG